MTWLYTYENRPANALYIGIGERISRVYQPHNEQAEELRDDPQTRVFRTSARFSTRKDALMAEAIAIHVASLFGADITVDAEIVDEVLADADQSNRGGVITNIAGTVQTRHLVPAVPVQEGAAPLRYSDLTGGRVGIVMTTLEDIGSRPALSGASSPQVLADRARQWWLLQQRMEAANRTGVWPSRLLLITTANRLIVGDWDLDPNRPMFSPDGDKWCEFELSNERWQVIHGNPTGDVGRVLDFDTDYGPMRGSMAAWSEDLRRAWGMLDAEED